MKKIVCLVVALSSSAAMLFADDARTVITQCTFTGFKNAIQTGMAWDWGGKVSVATALVVSDQNAPYHTEPGMASLFKKNGEAWDLVSADGTILTEGTYYLSQQIRIDGDYGTLYTFPTNFDDLSVTVDGVKWAVTDGWNDETYSLRYMDSPEFVLEHVVLPLQFTQREQIDYTINYLNTPVEEKDLKQYTTGGTGLYTYTRLTHHVTWLSVTEAGIISGTPIALDENDYFDTIRVSDGTSTDTLSLYVGPVYPTSASRQAVTEMTFTGFVSPKIGDAWDDYSAFESVLPAEGAPYYFNVGMGGLFKRSGADATRVSNGVILTEGEYFIQQQIRIDGKSGYYYVIGKDVNISVDGHPWTPIDAPCVDVNYSFINVRYEFTLPETASIAQLSTNSTPGAKRMVNGHLLLIKDGHTYNAQGILLR